MEQRLSGKVEEQMETPAAAPSQEPVPSRVDHSNGHGEDADGTAAAADGGGDEFVVCNGESQDASSSSHADDTIQKLTLELAQARKQWQEDIRARDDKYAELDTKFGRLQKRAKHRIQDVQKEKEELEARAAKAEEQAAQAAIEHSSLKKDLETARAQVQQLESSTLRLNNEIEDMRRGLDAKEHSLAESRHIASQKDQAALAMASAMKEAEEKHQIVVAELAEKHRKALEAVEARLGDAVKDVIGASKERAKLAETISDLQLQLADRESKLAELEAASSGESVRLGALLEGTKGELARLEQEHRNAQQVWEATVAKLNAKLEQAEKSRLAQEAAAFETKSWLESELQQQRQVICGLEADLVEAKEETAHLAKEMASYKVRAHALLQKKEAELMAAVDADLIAAQEEALQEAQRQAAAAATEKDQALKTLKEVIDDYETQLSTREMALMDAEQRIRDIATKLELAKGQLVSQQEEADSHFRELEATWRSRCDALEAKVKGLDVSNELALVRSNLERLQDEYDSFRAMATNMMEAKDQEISRLLDHNTSLQRSIQTQPLASSVATEKIVSEPQDLSVSVVAAAEQQILLLARQQAQREEEVAQCRRHIQALQEEIAELERENRLHGQQEAMLKEELRNVERANKRDGVDLTYLKNVILKLLETGEVEVLLPVVAMLLQFSPDEVRRCQEAYGTAPETPSTVDLEASTPRSFLSRLSFSAR